MKYGSPEKMTIHVRSTGETITLIDGLPVTDNAEKNPLLMRYCKAQKRELRLPMPVTDNRRCETCQSAFSSIRKDAKYCSPRCRQKAIRKRESQKHRTETAEMLASLSASPGGFNADA